MCHGTASQLAAMFQPSSVAWLQTGFRTPEIYTVVMVAVLGLGGDVSRLTVGIFYYATAMVRSVLCSCCSDEIVCTLFCPKAYG